MSIDCSRRVWDCSRASGNALIVLLALADNANSQGYCYPGPDDIMRRCKMRERAYQRALVELETLGDLIAPANFGRPAKRKRRRYHFCVAAGLSQEQIVDILEGDMKFDRIDAEARAREAITRRETPEPEPFLRKSENTVKSDANTDGANTVTSDGDSDEKHRQIWSEIPSDLAGNTVRSDGKERVYKEEPSLNHHRTVSRAREVRASASAPAAVGSCLDFRSEDSEPIRASSSSTRDNLARKPAEYSEEQKQVVRVAAGRTLVAFSQEHGREPSRAELRDRLILWAAGVGVDLELVEAVYPAPLAPTIPVRQFPMPAAAMAGVGDSPTVGDDERRALLQEQCQGLISERSNSDVNRSN